MGSLAANIPPPHKPGEMPYRVLGRTGEKVSLLGIGGASIRRNYVTRKDVDELFERAVDKKVNYVDTAPNYGDSEEKMGEPMKKYRDRFFLVTKTEEPSYEGTWRLLRQSLKRMKTDHIDLVHMHNLGREDRFPDIDKVLGEKGALGALREAKEKGVIRYIGASGHVYPARFHKALDTGEIDVLMNAVNFIARHVYDFESKVWARAREENIGLVAMKVLGGEYWTAPNIRGYRIPEEHYTDTMRYTISLPDVASAVIGFDGPDQFEKAWETITSVQPLTPGEFYELSLKGLKLTREEEWKTPYGTPTT